MLQRPKSQQCIFKFISQPIRFLNNTRTWLVGLSIDLPWLGSIGTWYSLGKKKIEFEVLIDCKIKFRSAWGQLGFFFF